MRTCTKCGVTKPLDEFHKSKTGKDGVQSRCKECRNVGRQRNRQVAGWRGPTGTLRLPGGMSID